MFAGGAKLAGILGVLVAALFLSGAAAAEGAKGPAAREATPGGGAGKLVEVDTQLEEVQEQAETATKRAGELDQQTRKLSRDLEGQREAASEAQDRFEERARAAYKGEDLAGVSMVLDGLLSGDSARVNTVLNGSMARVLLKGRGSIEFHKDSRQTLEDTKRQLRQKKARYEELLEERRERTEELRRREVKLRVAFGRPEQRREQIEERIVQLEEAEEAGVFTLPPASGDSESGGGGSVAPEQEFQIAQEDIVAVPVEEIPYERYVQIYKAAAKRYGFAEDWYILAAVGKVESDHGANMGPSSAGAMGPMQFLPSTWAQYGVDGNGDDEANIMDPEDAIPSAASYLVAGGAPDDWSAALFTYNRSGSYVREVLGVAESYKQQAEEDDEETEEG